MLGFRHFSSTRRALFGGAFLGALAISGTASATASRVVSCGVDEDCPAGAYCAGSECLPLMDAGAACNRDAMCASGLCFSDSCGELQIDSPVDGALTNEPKLVVTGRAPAGAPVEVSCDTTHDRVVADSRGQWVWSPSIELPAGQHTVGAQSGDAARQVVLDVDTTHPLNSIVSPLPSSVSSTGEVAIRGLMEAGARLQVMVDGVEVIVLADREGAWDHLHWLGNGWHHVQTRAIDPAGNVSDASVDFVVDLEAPIVKIQAPNDNAVYATTPEIMNGRAEPGATVHVVGHGVDATLGVPDSGAWSVLLPALRDGTYTYLVDVTDRAGWTANASVTITIDSVIPGLAFSTDLDQATLNVARPAFRGVTDPTCEVVLSLDGHRVGETLSDASGRWSVPLDHDLAAGVHDFAVSSTDRAGNVARFESWFVVDLSAPALSIVRPAHIVEGEPVALAGQTEAYAAIEARLDGQLVASATADHDGYWTVSFEAAFGPHAIEITTRDIAGRETVGQIDVTVDAPDADGGCNGAGASGLAAALGAVAMVLVRMRRLALAKA